MMVLACCTASAAGRLTGPAVTVLAIAAVAVAMWHGAYDHIEAERLLARPLGRRWLPSFLAGYLLLAAITLVGWYLSPLASLALFLLYSAWHFGTEPEQDSLGFLAAISALATGAVPIVAACYWRPEAVVPIFATMMRNAPHAAGSAPVLAQVLSRLCWPVLAVAAAGIVSGQLGRRAAVRCELIASVTLTGVLFAVCDPFLAFAVFFCCWHTPEHLLSTAGPLEAQDSLRFRVLLNLRAGLLPWLLSLVLLAAVLLAGRHALASYRAAIFIVLSALTVPHMALNELRRAGAGRGATSEA